MDKSQSGCVLVDATGAAPKSGCELAAPKSGCELAAPKLGCELAAPKSGCELADELAAPKLGCELAAPKLGCELADELAAPKLGCELADELAAPKSGCELADEIVYESAKDNRAKSGFRTNAFDFIHAETQLALSIRHCSLDKNLLIYGRCAGSIVFILLGSSVQPA